MPRLGLDDWDYAAEAWPTQNVKVGFDFIIDLGQPFYSYWTDRYWSDADDEDLNLLDFKFARRNTNFEQAKATVTISGNNVAFWDECLLYRQELDFPNDDYDIGLVSAFIYTYDEDEQTQQEYLDVGQGYIDTIDMVESGDDGRVIVINYEQSQFSFYEVPKNWRFDHTTQDQFFPGDVGFEFVERLADWDLWWGKAVKGGKKKRGKKKKRRRGN